MDDNVFRMMELRINGCIGLVREVSFLRVIVALCTEPPVNEKEKASALEMQKAVQWIKDHRETEIGKQLFEIEKEAMWAFYESFVYNSPFVILFFRYVARPVARFLPKITEKCRNTREYFMQETVPAIMVYVAR
jgi:ABC-type ATPase with predicted acetyltransferase domain